MIELPAIQAVFRAMGVAAMKGNRFVQKTLADMVARMEAEHHASRMELFGAMAEYKHDWGKEIERCRKAGIPEPEPIPHPDDIILDPATGNVRIEAGHVWLPEQAPWLEELRLELARFPQGRNDDQVDSISQCLAWHFSRKGRAVQFCEAGRDLMNLHSLPPPPSSWQFVKQKMRLRTRQQS